MKLFTSNDSKSIDTYAIKELGIDSIVLMEHAASHCFNFISSIICVENQNFCIILGKGNNAGDGLALARMLSSNGAEVYLLKCFEDFKTKDSKKEYEIVKKIKNIKLCDITNIPSDAFIIDAVFGTGFIGVLPDKIRSIFKNINNNFKNILSIDVPSGVNASVGTCSPDSIKAKYTISFLVPKIGLYSAPGAINAGLVYLKKLYFTFKEPSSKIDLIDKNIVNNILNKLSRDLNSHKGTYGHVGVFASNKEMQGAISLASSALLRSGTGKVSIFSLDETVSSLRSRFSKVDNEVIFSKDDISSLDKYSKILIGPGFDKSKYKDLILILKNFKNGIVIDADAINLLSFNNDLNLIKAKNIILTPHPGEMGRLLNTSSQEVQSNRLNNVINFVQTYKTNLILKGYRTICIDEEENILINTSGNPSLAKAGTGDVLSGMITSFWAQGLNPIESMGISSYLHGHIADILSKNMSKLSVNATDLVNNLVKVLSNEEV